MAIPTRAIIDQIPLAKAGEYELSEREARTLRTRLYAINKDGIRRYRTVRDGPHILVWRIK